MADILRRVSVVPPDTEIRRLRDMGDGSWAEVTTLPVPSVYHSTAYEASAIAKASAGTLYGVSGYNSGPDQFIQIHDSATLPANGVAPAIPGFKVNSGRNFSWRSNRGYPMASGIVVCNSTTNPLKTIGASDCTFNVAYGQ